MAEERLSVPGKYRFARSHFDHPHLSRHLSITLSLITILFLFTTVVHHTHPVNTQRVEYTPIRGAICLPTHRTPHWQKPSRQYTTIMIQQNGRYSCRATGRDSVDEPSSPCWRVLPLQSMCSGDRTHSSSHSLRVPLPEHDEVVTWRRPTDTLQTLCADTPRLVAAYASSSSSVIVLLDSGPDPALPALRARVDAPAKENGASFAYASVAGQGLVVLRIGDGVA